MHLDGMSLRTGKFFFDLVTVCCGQFRQVSGQLVAAGDVGRGQLRLGIAEWPNGTLRLKKADKNQARVIGVKHPEVQRNTIRLFVVN